MGLRIIAYQIFLACGLLLLSPLLLFSAKARAGLSEKLGFLSGTLRRSKAASAFDPKRRSIWFHAVSVGEFNAVFPLIQEFHLRHPDFEIFLSTTTRTGQEQAQKKASSFACVFYFPFDFSFSISKYLDYICPELVVLVETEIWPAFMYECQSRRSKVVLVNGRLSPRSFEGYKRWKWFFAPVVSSFTHLCLQSEQEKLRFLELMQEPAAEISVCGNIKLDGLKAADSKEIERLRKQLAIVEGRKVLVAGSTHEGEETALLQALSGLDHSFSLILVPRHPERFDRVAGLIEKAGCRARRFSKNECFESNKDVYLLDTIGQLNKFYALADLAFVGGTIANIGGHNLSEPCIYRVPVLCGPHVHKQKDMYQGLLEYQAISTVADPDQLRLQIEALFADPDSARSMGEKGFRFLEDSQGALVKTLAVLEEYLNLAVPEMKIEPVGGLRR